MELADKLQESSGYGEISLTSLSTSDYSGLPELTSGLIEEMEPRMVNLSLPSLRIDSFSLDLLEKVQKVRKSGLTFAPEAGTQRLRDIINKGVTEEDLLNSVGMAFRGGWSGVKLYFRSVCLMKQRRMWKASQSSARRWWTSFSGSRRSRGPEDSKSP